MVKHSRIENRLFNKEEGDDDDDEEEDHNNVLSNLEKGIAADFILIILQKLSAKRKNINVSKRLRNLVK